MNRVASAILVVILILLAGALFLVYLDRSREPVERLRCQNNLMETGKAVEAYYTRHRVFPPGVLPQKGLPPEKSLSWITGLLPYTEYGKVYDQLDLDAGWAAPANRPAVATRLLQFHCPAWKLRAEPGQPALTTYVGIAGLGLDAATLPANHPRNGFFGYTRTITLADIEDGLSTTFVGTETTRGNGPWAAGGPATVRGLDPDGHPYLGPGRQFGGLHFTSPGTVNVRFQSGANVLYADLSARFITESVAPAVFAAQTTISGEK